ncbi:MAG: DUF4175 family protein [Elusimicrobia bacterium]|nr:DUF4175 family protein [Elusimicrobiota bacterium]
MNKTILNFRRRALALSVLLASARGLLRVLPIAVGGALALAGLDRWMELSPLVRQAAWLAVVGGAGAALASGFLPARIFSSEAQSRELSRRAVERGLRFREDDLRLALELQRPASGASDDLRLAFIEDVGGRLAAARPSWCFPSGAWRDSVIGAVFAAVVAVTVAGVIPDFWSLAARVLDPFQSGDVERGVRITPGDAEVFTGSDVTVTLALVDPHESRPDLLLRSGSGWATVPPEADGATRTFRLKNVVQPVSYRVRWKGERSRRFEIRPVDPVRLSALSITVTPPDYTGKKPYVQKSPEITGLAGTNVDINARASRELGSAEVLFSDGRVRPVTLAADRALSTSFQLVAGGTYRFRMTEKGKTQAVDGDLYPLNVVPDRAPEIHLLSPTDPLALGERERLPLTYDVRDDIALSEVRLEWEVRGKHDEARARRFDDRPEGGIFTYQWDVAGSGIKAGDRARYRLVAVDGNTVTGPGTAATPWMDLEIESFEREHEALGQALDAWRDKTVDLLAKLNTLKARTDKPDENLDAVAGEFSGAANLSKGLEEMLRQIVSRMENDPLADTSVLNEHKAMLESLQMLNRSVAPAAQAALNTHNRQAASQNIEAMSSEIERMSALSDDLTKRRNARDMVDAGDQLDKLGEQLKDKLESGAPVDAATQAQINDLLNEARRNLEKMARALQQKSKELPEDFVNQQALKNIPLGKASDMLSKIAEALKNGDTKTALQLAQEFARMTRQMQKDLAQAEDNFGKSSTMSELEKKINEQAQKVDKLVEDQRSLLAGTQPLENGRLERLLKAQEDAFQKLAARQRETVNKTRAAVQKGLIPPAALALGGELAPMEQVLRELETKRIEHSFDLLPAIGTRLQSTEDTLNKSTTTAAAVGPVREARLEEASLLEDLKKLRDLNPPPPPGDKPAFESLRQRQDALAKQTLEVRQQLQALSRKTASLGLPVTQPLNDAAAEMSGAGDRLGQQDSKGGLQKEETALTKLLDAQSALSQAQESMAQGAGEGEGGGGSGPRIVARARSAASQRGTRAGQMRFPTADDYRPPREFREDLLESLKENYPKIYEEIIHKYYKRLAE